MDKYLQAQVNLALLMCIEIFLGDHQEERLSSG